MSKKMKRWTEESSSGAMRSASYINSSSDDMSLEETRPPRRRSQSRRNARRNEDKVTIMMLSELHKEMRKQSKQLAGSKDETSEMRKQLEKLIESHNDQTKKLEMLTESLNGLCKKMEFHTDGKSTDYAAAPRSQLNQVQPPRYQLVFTSGEIGRIGKGETFEISVALVGNNGQPVENGPLASATVELVVVKAEFNQHDNEYNWSREDFERNIIKRSQQGNPATGDVDKSVKSIVSNGRFNLVHGAKCHNGSTILINSSNRKVRFGVMVVLPMETRVLEGLSNSFFVRGHDRPARQNNIRCNRSNTQRLALVDNGYQEENGPIANMQNPSWPNPIAAGGMSLNTTGEQPQLLPFVEYPTMPSSGLNIPGGQPQLPFVGNTTMPSTELSTSLDQHVSMQQYHIHHWPIFSQATNNQTGMQFNTSQIALPVHLIWDRPNVEPSKHHWELLEKLMPLYKFNRCGLPMHLMQEHFGSLTVIPREVVQTRWKNAFIEPLEPDDSDKERPLKRKLRNEYRLRFLNEVCKAYYTWDQIKADDGSLVKVALYDENNIKITSGPLSSASVEVVALHGDFNVNARQDYWTLEEFSDSIVCPPPGKEASSVSVLAGDRILVLADGEACLSNAFFQRTSICARTGMFRMGVMLASAQDERVQEGISKPFRVMDNCVKELHAKDGPTQGFNPAAATVLFPRNTVTETIQQQASIPHQISHLKTRSAPCMNILPAAQHTTAMTALGILEARTKQQKRQLLRPTEVSASRTLSPMIRRRSYMRHKLHLAPMLVPSTPSWSFLQRCFLCRRKLTEGMDIYMYRGDRAFCSESCRCRHMMEEDRSAAIDTGAPDLFHRSGSCFKATPSVWFFLEGGPVQG